MLKSDVMLEVDVIPSDDVIYRKRDVRKAESTRRRDAAMPAAPDLGSASVNRTEFFQNYTCLEIMIFRPRGSKQSRKLPSDFADIQ